MASGDIAFSVLRTVEEVAAIETEWRDLCGRVPTHKYSQEPDWCRRIWSHTGTAGGRHLHVVVGRVDGRLVLIWPLVVHRRPFLRIAQGIAGDQTDYDDVLVDESSEASRWLANAWRFVAATVPADVLSLRRVRDDEGLSSLVSGMPTRWEQFSSSPVVSFRGLADWSQFYATLSRNFRKGTEWRRRRLSREGEWRFEVLEDADRGLEALDWIMQQKEVRLAQRSQRLLRRHERTGFAEFQRYRDLIEASARDAFLSRRLHVSRLVLGDRTIAALSAIRAADRFDGWHFAYDITYQACSPGRLIIAEFLRWAFEQGAERVDFMPEPDPYKLDWANEHYGVRNCRVALTAKGRLYVGWCNGPIRRAAIRAYLRLPERLQVAIRTALS